MYGHIHVLDVRMDVLRIVLEFQYSSDLFNFISVSNSSGLTSVLFLFALLLFFFLKCSILLALHLPIIYIILPWIALVKSSCICGRRSRRHYHRWWSHRMDTRSIEEFSVFSSRHTKNMITVFFFKKAEILKFESRPILNPKFDLTMRKYEIVVCLNNNRRKWNIIHYFNLDIS